MVVNDTVTVDVLGRLDRRNAAKALSKSCQTLANWKVQGIGPVPFSINGRCYYWANEVFAYGRGESLSEAA